ncbi:hypothetical protein BDN70DRAFT_117006 [Pholiota conissans]|uniref:Uncharacterized protein n=1 Tax=Pholiota conissans TaxID=109636 RepID=A0A9P5Z053_9AGAR|nr:hypothetical protein BDN70DRAFT_117006 [Pholiota conissans]
MNVPLLHLFDFVDHRDYGSGRHAGSTFRTRTSKLRLSRKSRTATSSLMCIEWNWKMDCICDLSSPTPAWHSLIPPGTHCFTLYISRKFRCSVYSIPLP